MTAAWVAFGVAIVALIALAMHARRRNAELVGERDSERERAIEAARDSEARIARINREAEGTKGARRDEFLRDLLPVFDAVEQALAVAEGEVAHGLELVQRQAEDVMSRHGIEVLRPSPGDSFDAHDHEAIQRIEEPLLPPGSIGTCLRAGYRAEGRVLRAAMVTVVAAPAQTSAGEAGVEPPAAPDEPSEPAVDDEPAPQERVVETS